LTTTGGGVVIGDFEPFAVTRIEQMPHIPDTDSIGFNPRTGLLHHLSGAESWSNNPDSPGYHDNHFMQTLDPADLTQPGTVVFNANSVQWGPAGPRPTWVLPATRRTPEQNTDTFRDMRGPGEYHAPRDVVWSDAHNAFFLSDERGIFRLTADGQSTFVGASLHDPADPKSGVEDDLKGLAFFTIGGQRRLLASERADSNTPDHLWTIDPATGQKVGQPVTLTFSDGSPVLGVLSIVEHPDGEVLLGIVQDAEGVAGRKLAQINPVTGETTVIGNFMTHMADLAFVWPAGGPSVTAVHVGGTAWTPEFLAELAEENLGGPRGFRIDGAGGQDELPWSNINQVSITFDQDVTVDQGDLTVRGVRVPTYAVTAFTYDAPSRTATWTLDRPLANFSTTNRQAADEVTIQLATDVADYEQTIDVVPGDANRNGNVSPTDFGTVRSGIGRNTVDEGTSPNHYTVYKDVNANGNISPTDIGVVRGNTGAAAPVPPAAGSLAGSSATRDVLFGDNEIL
ncbi:MAG TPA: dockerin type I domain-containing protein, partial [Tepidisphaeraceae bacterium]|nr:dockerin type I domain-containing protein [Tepidisphaeraceae bacterium]